MDDRAQEQHDGAGDPGHSAPLDPHLWHQRSRMSGEHRRMGLDARTEEGALVEFASSLDATRPAHRVVAWVLLVAFAVPAASMLLRLLGELFSAVR